jgi:hypothetical protein
MKSIRVIIALLAISTGFCASSFGQDKQVQKARTKVTKAKQDLKEAKIDSAEDYNKFVHQAELNIKQNKDAIGRLKTKEMNEHKDDHNLYNKKVMDLEAKNDRLERRIKDSHHTKTNGWERFKLNFNRDMQKLGEDIKGS